MITGIGELPLITCIVELPEITGIDEGCLITGKFQLPQITGIVELSPNTDI